jgi:hypothetical protein
MSNKRTHNTSSNEAADDNPAPSKSLHVDEENREEASAQDQQQQQQQDERKVAEEGQQFECGNCTEGRPESIAMPCCGKGVCHGCLCKIYLESPNTCAFCRQSYALSQLHLVLVRFEQHCKKCGLAVEFSKNCYGKDCPKSAFGDAGRNERLQMEKRRLIGVIERGNRDGQFMNVHLKHGVMLSWGAGPTLPTKKFRLKGDGTVCYWHAEEKAWLSWSHFTPQWYPFMSSTSSLFKPA